MRSKAQVADKVEVQEALPPAGVLGAEPLSFMPRHLPREPAKRCFQAMAANQGFSTAGAPCATRLSLRALPPGQPQANRQSVRLGKKARRQAGKAGRYEMQSEKTAAPLATFPQWFLRQAERIAVPLPISRHRKKQRERDAAAARREQSPLALPPSTAYGHFRRRSGWNSR